MLTGNKKSIQTQIFSLVLFTSVFCAIIISVAAIILSSFFVVGREKDIAAESLKASASMTDSILGDAEYLMDLIMSDAEIQTALKQNYSSVKEKYSSNLDVAAHINTLSMYADNISSVSVIGCNGLLSNSSALTFRTTDFSRDEFFCRVLNSSSPSWYYSSDGSKLLIGVTGRGCVAYLGMIKNLSNGKPLGIASIEIPLSAFRNSLSNSSNFDTLYIYDDALTPVLNYSTSNGVGAEAVIDKSYFPSSSTEEIVTEKIPGHLLMFTSLENGWHMVDVISTRNIISSSVKIASVILIMLCMLSVVIYFFAERRSRRLTRRLSDMSRQIGKIGAGDFSVRMDASGSDEISTLALHFNTMIDRISDLMNEIYENQQELRRAELRTLQAQIKPHFLYNTLETIAWLARFGKSEDVVTVVMALTTYFRHGLNSGEDMISLKKELEQVQSYIVIQSYRYNNSFRYSTDVDKDIEPMLQDILIPKLVLQPLIENALHHGLKGCNADGYIHIGIRSDDDNIYIEVYDNGDGIDEATLESLRNMRNEHSNASPAGFGLHNVDTRIKMFFGSHYGLSFESAEGQGTTVTINLPKNPPQQHG